jgi:beta-glucosidase
MMNKSMILLSGMLFFASAVADRPARYGDWTAQEIQNNMTFPATFQFGTICQAYEIEGNAVNNTWVQYENHKKPNGKFFTQQSSGIACDSWNRYQEDIQLIKQAGMTSYCFSIDWSKIQPSQGMFDEQALQHYVDVCDELNRNGIEPVIIFKDYRDPIWFIEIGGFEREANIAVFEHYCLTVFNRLQGKVHTFITFWSPESYAMLSYWNESHPPFKKHNMQLAIDVFKNELEAHVRVYQSMKKANRGNPIKIGITKHVVQLEPAHIWDRIPCSKADSLTNEPFYGFFTTGKFDVSMRLPARWGGVVTHHKNHLAPRSIDFVGINYHCHNQMRNFKRIPFANERRTDIKEVTVDPKGLFFAIEEVSHKLARKLNIPILVTQNGIATRDDALRALHTEFNLCSVAHAIKAGHNVQGYYYYSLLDGFTYAEYGKQFGLFAVDRLTMQRRVKPGAARYIEIAHEHRAFFDEQSFLQYP